MEGPGLSQGRTSRRDRFRADEERDGGHGCKPRRRALEGSVLSLP